MDHSSKGSSTGTGTGGSGGTKGGGGGQSSSGGSGMMKAPGGDGAYVSRTGFEANPKGYFTDLHAAAKNSGHK